MRRQEQVNSETESKTVAARGWGSVGNGCLMGTDSVSQDEKSCGDWLGNNVNILNTIELKHLKTMKVVNFMSHVLHHN